MTGTVLSRVLMLPVDAETLAALHGKACVVCGASGVRLVDAGFCQTISGAGRLGWPVAACPDHGLDTPERTR